MNQSSMNRLTTIGFTVAGRWTPDGSGIHCELNEHAPKSNILYAFVVDSSLMYVGQTVQPLRTRMAGYRSPGPTQSTNIRNRRHIRECLDAGKLVEIFVLPDNRLLHYGGFHVNLAAGLEDSIIRELTPAWNGGKKESPNQTLELTEPAILKGPSQLFIE